MRRWSLVAIVACSGPSQPVVANRAAPAQAPLVTADCVRASGQSSKTVPEHGTPSGTCWMIVDCVTEMGTWHPGDGAVELSCVDTTCSCIQHARTRSGDKLERVDAFVATSPCFDGHVGEQLLVEHCLGGRPLPQR